MTKTCPGPQLINLLPPSIANDLDLAAYELARAVLIRSTYVPGIRHRLGWRGIHESVTPGMRPGSLTAKVNDRPGVFAFHPIEPGPGHVGRFSLSYFPAPDEALVENFSIEAGIQALTPDFIKKVRRFNRHLELTVLFHVGIIECLLDNHGVFISFQARQRLGWVAEQGVEIQTPDGPAQAVAPGGVDQDLPALEIGMSFFRPFAASFSYTLGTAPTQFHYQGRRAENNDSAFFETDEQRLTLGYFSDGEKAGAAGWQNALTETTWHSPTPLPRPYEDELWWRPDLTGANNNLDKKTMGITDRPRFILLTGFLGTGKTSFLDHFIQSQAATNNFVAVIQNEIGEKGLDAALLDETYAVTEMDEGCVCCSLSGNLRAALADILDRFQPDFIVLETTGLANPANILTEIDELNDLLEFGSVTTIVDSGEGIRTLERFEVARDQVRLADVILINKCDLGGPDRKALEEHIRRLNPVAAIHEARHGDIHPGILYGVNFRSPVNRPLFTTMGNHATHADDQIETRLIDLENPVSEAGLQAAIETGGEKILRVKGIAEFKGRPGPMVFQYAPGTFNIQEFSGKDTGERFLVVIGQDLKNNFNDRGLFQ